MAELVPLMTSTAKEHYSSIGVLTRLWRVAESPRRLLVGTVLVVALEGFLKALPIQWLRDGIDAALTTSSTVTELATYAGAWYGCYAAGALVGLASSYLTVRLAAGISPPYG